MNIYLQLSEGPLYVETAAGCLNKQQLFTTYCIKFKGDDMSICSDHKRQKNKTVTAGLTLIETNMYVIGFQ